MSFQLTNYEEVLDLITNDNNWSFDADMVDFSIPSIQQERVVTDSNVTSSLNITSDDRSRFIARPYPPLSYNGFIHEHDRPYAQFGHLGKYLFHSFIHSFN